MLIPVVFPALLDNVGFFVVVVHGFRIGLDYCFCVSFRVCFDPSFRSVSYVLGAIGDSVMLLDLYCFTILVTKEKCLRSVNCYAGLYLSGGVGMDSSSPRPNLVLLS